MPFTLSKQKNLRSSEYQYSFVIDPRKQNFCLSLTLGPYEIYGICGRPKLYEQNFQTIPTSLFDFSILAVDIVYYQLLLGYQVILIKTQKSEVLDQFLIGLLESYEDS